MIDLKYTISRSFSRKISLGNYEMADFFATHSEEILTNGHTEEDLRDLSLVLYQRAKDDVEKSITEFINGRNRKQDMKLEQQAEQELNFGLDLQDEQDRSEKLKEANKNLGTK